MTKTRVFGQDCKAEKPKKKIKFNYLLGSSMAFETPNAEPESWSNVVLLRLNYSDKYDLMYAYDEEPNRGVFYIGHWNDGVV